MAMLENSKFKFVKSTGYTMMGNYHLRDKKLTLKAKGLMSVMLSMSETWRHSVSGYTTTCVDGVDSVRSAMKELEKNGYITRRRLRNSKGHLTITEYTIYEIPLSAVENLEPKLENAGMVIAENPLDMAESEDFEPEILEPTYSQPKLEKPTLDNPSLENPRQLINKELNNNKINTKKSNPNLNPNPNPKVCGYETMGFDSLEALEQFVHKNIDYQFYNKHGNQDEKNLINMLAQLIVEVVCNTQDTINISGQDFPSDMVKNRLMKFNATHVEYVRECLNKNKSEVRNIKRYLLATMFNAPVTLDSYYAAMVYHDLHKDEKSE